jgi:hypothetical protein
VRWTDLTEAPSKITVRKASDLPPVLYHGTCLRAVADMIYLNTIQKSVKRDRGPDGVSLSRSLDAAKRFSNSGGDPNLCGCVIELDVGSLLQNGYTIVHYRGAYASREQEERVLGDIKPMLPHLRRILVIGAKSPWWRDEKPS